MGCSGCTWTFRGVVDVASCACKAAELVAAAVDPDLKPCDRGGAEIVTGTGSDDDG